MKDACYFGFLRKSFWSIWYCCSCTLFLLARNMYITSDISYAFSQLGDIPMLDKIFEIARVRS